MSGRGRGGMGLGSSGFNKRDLEKKTQQRKLKSTNDALRVRNLPEIMSVYTMNATRIEDTQGFKHTTCTFVSVACWLIGCHSVSCHNIVMHHIFRHRLNGYPVPGKHTFKNFMV